MKIITSLVTVLLAGGFAFGQYYYLENSGTTPGGLNTDETYPAGGGQPAGWTSILGPSVGTPTWSANQSIPFSFNFNGSAVTDFKVSSTGVLTFTTGAGAVPGSTPEALPSANVPDNSVCVWGLEASGANDNVSLKTFGTAPNRQLWIHFSSCTNGSISWSYWSIVLEESSDKIYICDQRNTTGTGALSAGIQIDGGTAISITGSPALGATAGTDPTSADDQYYEFIYGTQPANEIELTNFDILPYVGTGNVNIEGTIKNLGSDPITAFDVTWNNGGGPQVDNITGLNIPSNGTYDFTHATPMVATSGQSYTIDLSVSMAGDANTNNNALQASTVALTTIPTKYVVGEEKTGTWCGWCPRGAVALAGMESESRFIGIAVHNNDPMTVASYDGAIGTYVPGGYPGGGVDRVIDGDPSSFQQMFNQREGEVVPCAVDGISAGLNTGTNQIEVDASVAFYGTIVGNYRMSMVIVEDDVIGTGANWSQVNYYDGGGNGTLTDPVTSFEWSTAGDPVNPSDFGGYDHVARHLSGNDILGDAGSLPAGSVPEGLHSHTFSPVASNVVDDISKAHVIVMIVNADNGEILNAGKTTIGTASVGEIEMTNDFVLYPNPTAENANLTFELNEGNVVSLEVRDALGKVVFASAEKQFAAGKHDTMITTNQLPEGVYFVNLNVGGQVVTKKLTVVR